MHAFYRPGVGEVEYAGFAFAGGTGGQAFDFLFGNVGVHLLAFVSGEFGEGDFATGGFERRNLLFDAAEEAVVFRLEVIVYLEVDEKRLSNDSLNEAGEQVADAFERLAVHADEDFGIGGFYRHAVDAALLLFGND